MRKYLFVTLSVVIALWLGANWLSAVSAADTEPRNFLPNASFELGLGQGLPTNWGDLLNPLTIKLAATDQYPEAGPVIEEAADAPEGHRVARISVKSGAPAHLSSSAVPIERGRAYVLTVFARSDVPSAQLRLSLWTRPLDWREAPDAQSQAMPLSDEWRRYEFSFTVGMHVELAVVDLCVNAEKAGNVWFDAVQLEAGPSATSFSTRFPIEVGLSAQDKPFNGGLHLLGQPVTIDVDLYNSTNHPYQGDLELAIRDRDGNVVNSKSLDDPVPPGRSHRKIAVDLGLVGNFRANCRLPNGPNVDIADYIFTVHPVIPEDMQGILVSVDGKVRRLPAQRVRLPWTNTIDWYAGVTQKLTVNKDGSIYVFADRGGAILRTDDGGLTWESCEADNRPPAGFKSTMRDGSFLLSFYDEENRRLLIKRSEDRGKTWQSVGEITNIPPDYHPGPITELHDGSYIFPMGHTREGFGHSDYAYRSSDRGKSWKGYPISPGGEPFVCQLKSGRLLAVIRDNASAPPGLWELYFKNKWNWQIWQRAYAGRAWTRNRLTSYKKNLIMLDSDDGGITWKNARDVTYGLGEMHGMAVELPDERLVLIYTHRVPWLHGGERAKISSDGGNTWGKELYHLNTTLAYPDYSGSCVLPPELADGKPGMILSVIGERGFSGHPPKILAVRWRPLPK